MEDRKPLQDYAEITFMALTVWREARGESMVGKAGVAHSIMNRVRHPKWWGKTVMEVLFKKWQYSSLTDPNDKQLTTWPQNDPIWRECLTVAHDVYYGLMDNPVPEADSYHDISIPSPKWATPDMFVRQVGRLKFYNVDGDYERPITPRTT